MPLSPAHLCGTHLLLQDRNRLPCLAERPPGRFRHGGRPAVRSLSPSPNPRLRAGQRGAIADRPRPRGAPPRSVVRSPAWPDDRPGGAGPALAQPADHRLLVAARKRSGASTPASARSGSGANSSPRLDSTRPAGWSRSRGCASPRCAGAGSSQRPIPTRQREAEASNREAIEEAAALNAVTLVLVPGGLPLGDRDLQAARDRAARAIERLVPYAHELGSISVEPMNPIYAADRGVISTLAQALDIAERFDASDVGVVVDTFHCGGNPASTSSCARGTTDCQLPDLRLDHPAAGGHALSSRHDGRRSHRLPPSPDRLLGPAIAAMSRWRSSMPIYGPRPGEVVDTMAERYLELVHPYLAE